MVFGFLYKINGGFVPDFGYFFCPAILPLVADGLPVEMEVEPQSRFFKVMDAFFGDRMLGDQTVGK